MHELIDRALAEDVGDGDLTTRILVPPDARATARIVQKEPGVIAGLDVAEAVFARFDVSLAEAPDGVQVCVECETPEDVDIAIEAGARRLLLDNMGPSELVECVARAGGVAALEASGGVTLENVREIAETGVDFISVGALTHSARALDLSLLFES